VAGDVSIMGPVVAVVTGISSVPLAPVVRTQ